MIEISMRDANDYVQSVILEKENKILHIAWNPEHYGWFVDVRTMSNEDIIKAIAIVPNLPLFNQYRRVGDLPEGELMAVVVDSDGENNQTIGRDDFVNGRFTLVYIPVDEVDGFEQAMETALQNIFP